MAQTHEYTIDQVQRFCLDWSQGKWTVYKETRARNSWSALEDARDAALNPYRRISQSVWVIIWTGDLERMDVFMSRNGHMFYALPEWNGFDWDDIFVPTNDGWVKDSSGLIIGIEEVTLSRFAA
jgi:hypothetical protein